MPRVEVPNTRTNVPALRTNVPQRQNLLNYSNDLLNGSGWGPLGASTTVASDTTLPPIEVGLTGTAKINEVAISSLHSFYSIGSNQALEANVMYTVSGYFKDGNRGFAGIRIDLGAGALDFLWDLTTGAVTLSSYSGSCVFATPVAVAKENGWWRLSVTFQLNSRVNSVFPCQIILSTNGVTESYLGDITKYIYATGMQLVLANWPGVYTVTTSAPVNTGVIRSVAGVRSIAT